MKNAIATAILFLASGGATLAFARSARVAVSNVGFRLVLALATLGFDLATLDLSAAAVRIIQNYSFV